MRRVTVVGLLVFLLCGCAFAGSGEEGEGYLLRSEEEGPSAGTLYLRYVSDEQAQTIAGYLYVAYPAEDPEGAFISTERITGSVDGPRVLVRLESNSQHEYVGTVEGDAMELRSGLVSFRGEAATFEDFGNATEEMAKASREWNFAD